MRKGAVLGPGEGPLSLIRKPAAPRPYHSRGRSLHTPLTCAFGASSPPKGRGKEERASRARTAEAQASRAGMTKEAHAPPFPDSSPPAGERIKERGDAPRGSRWRQRPPSPSPLPPRGEGKKNAHRAGMTAVRPSGSSLCNYSLQDSVVPRRALSPAMRGIREPSLRHKAGAWRVSLADLILAKAHFTRIEEPRRAPWLHSSS